MSVDSEMQKALRLVREGASRVTRHRELIAELRAEGNRTTIAERILSEFEDIQAARLTDLGKCRRVVHVGRRARGLKRRDLREFMNGARLMNGRCRRGSIDGCGADAATASPLKKGDTDVKGSAAVPTFASPAAGRPLPSSLYSFCDVVVLLIFPGIGRRNL